MHGEYNYTIAKLTKCSNTDNLDTHLEVTVRKKLQGHQLYLMLGLENASLAQCSCRKAIYPYGFNPTYLYIHKLFIYTEIHKNLYPK